MTYRTNEHTKKGPPFWGGRRTLQRSSALSALQPLRRTERTRLVSDGASSQVGSVGGSGLGRRTGEAAKPGFFGGDEKDFGTPENTKIGGFSWWRFGVKLVVGDWVCMCLYGFAGLYR